MRQYVIPAEEPAQCRAALRALPAKPLLVADTDGEKLILVRWHLTELREWLNRETGWRLVADSETAGLFKTAPVPSDASHPRAGATRSRSACHQGRPSRGRGSGTEVRVR